MGDKTLNPGVSYEKIVANIYRQFAGVAEVIENEHIVGKSGRNRQIDVALRTEVAGNPLLVVVECKDYKRCVGIGKVDELIGKIDDVGAALGLLVSDSGFDAGAVARARSDNRIRLASVLDAENASLRSRMTLSVSVAFHKLESINFSLEGDLSLDEGELMAIGTQEQVNIQERFFAWYNENTSDLRAGDHEHTQTITITPNRSLIAKCSFRQSVRVFFNENVWAKGMGIYDHVKQEVVQGGEFKRVVLDFPYIEANWREITGNENAVEVGSYYKWLALYGANALKRIEDHTNAP